MSELVQSIGQVRDSICAIMRVVKVEKRGKRGPPRTGFTLAFVGTAWCMAQDRLLLTAHHILNGGKPRDPRDLFYAFTVPGNGDRAFHFPVTGFPLEDTTADVAVLELGPAAEAGQHIPSASATFSRPPDGSRVFTIGFPAAAIQDAQLDPDGHFLGGAFFLKSHCNEGIVAGQYSMANIWFYEFNVHWHQGESGGPVFLCDPVAAFAIMQQYRNVETPHGILPGPHRGRALDCIKAQLVDLGAFVV